MKTLFLLITLTQNGAGDINASFVNTETLDQCQQKIVKVESVFIASDIPVIVSRCMKSDMKFSEFGHASAASAIRNFYLISFDETSMKITAMPDWNACIKQRNISKQGSVYCSSSVQSVL